MNASTSIVSHYGNRVIKWDAVALNEVLAQLRREREQHEVSINTEVSEAWHNALMAQAEGIKHKATNQIPQRSTRCES